MKYRFAIGSSTNEGSGVGVCFTIEAETEEEAVRKANTAIEVIKADGLHLRGFTLSEGISIYIGPELLVTPDNIEDVT